MNLDLCYSKMIYERSMQSQVLYVVPNTTHYFNIGETGFGSVGNTGNIPFSTRRETRDFPGASCDLNLKEGDGDGNRWWYINSNAMNWATSQ